MERDIRGLLGVQPKVRDYLRLQDRKHIDYKAESDSIINGTVVSGTINTLTDTVGGLIPGQWKNYIMKIFRNGASDFEYGVILDNTENVFTFDDDLIFVPCDLCSWKIIETIKLEEFDVNYSIALDLSDGDVGVLLPPSTELNERYWVHVYIEIGNGGIHSSPIMCRGLERQLGAKYGTLEWIGEGVRLLAHQWNFPHWDVEQAFNVKRFATGYVDVDIPITTVEYATVGNNIQLLYDNVRRFIPVLDGGIQWLRYTSLLKRDFSIKFSGTISKTGAGGDLSLTIAIKDGDTGVITFLDDREASTRFGGGEGIADLSHSNTVYMKRNDQIAIASKRTSGTFSILAGSTVEIIEY